MHVAEFALVQVLVFFTQNGAGPQVKMGKIVGKLAEEMTDVCFVTVNITVNKEVTVAREHGIPAFQLYKSGDKVAEFSVGSEDELKNAIAGFE